MAARKQAAQRADKRATKAANTSKKTEDAQGRKLTPKQEKVLLQLLDNPSLKECAEETGVSYQYVKELHTKTYFIEALELARGEVSDKAKAIAGIDAASILQYSDEVRKRCMQEEPVKDKLGRETGLFKFEHSGANKAIELMGKNRLVSAFGKEVEEEGRAATELIIQVVAPS